MRFLLLVATDTAGGSGRNGCGRKLYSEESLNSSLESSGHATSEAGSTKSKKKSKSYLRGGVVGIKWVWLYIYDIMQRVEVARDMCIRVMVKRMERVVRKRMKEKRRVRIGKEEMRDPRTRERGKDHTLVVKYPVFVFYAI